MQAFSGFRPRKKDISRPKQIKSEMDFSTWDSCGGALLFEFPFFTIFVFIPQRNGNGRIHFVKNIVWIFIDFAVFVMNIQMKKIINCFKLVALKTAAQLKKNWKNHKKSDRKQIK